MPYHASTLTAILQDALGGSGKAVLLIELSASQISNEAADTKELQSLLTFGTTARNIKNNATVSRKFLAQRALLMAYRNAMGIREPLQGDESSDSDLDDVEAAACYDDDGATAPTRAKPAPPREQAAAAQPQEVYLEMGAEETHSEPAEEAPAKATKASKKAKSKKKGDDEVRGPKVPGMGKLGMNKKAVAKDMKKVQQHHYHN